MADIHEIQEFDGYERARWERLKADITRKTGIEIPGDSGVAAAKGIEVKYTFDEAKQSVTIQVTKRAWYDPSEAQIDQMIHIEAENA